MSGYTDLTKMENTRNCLRRIARHDEPQFSKDSILNVMEKFVKTVSVMDDTILVPCRLMDRQVGDSTDITPISGKNVTSNQHTYHQVPNGHIPYKSKNVHEFLNSSELFNLYNMLNALKNDLLWTNSQDDNDDEQDHELIKTKYGNDEANFSTNMVMALNGGTELCQQQNYSKTEQNTAGSNSNINGNINSNSTNNNGNCNSNSNNVCNVVVVASKSHMRRTSTASMASIASVSQMSDSESDTSNENDSGVEMLEANTNKNDDGVPGSSSSSSSSSENDVVQLKKSNTTDKATELAKRCRRHLNGLYQCLEQMTAAANYLTARYQNDIGGGSV